MRPVKKNTICGIIGLSAGLLACVVGIVLPGIAQQQPLPPGSSVLRFSNEQQMLFENILLRQENLRLQVCLSQSTPGEECGQFVQGGVLRIPKPQPTAAVKQPTHEEAQKAGDELGKKIKDAKLNQESAPKK